MRWLLSLGEIFLRSISFAASRVVAAPSIWLEAMASSIIELMRYNSCVVLSSGKILEAPQEPPKFMSNSWHNLCIVFVREKWILFWAQILTSVSFLTDLTLYHNSISVMPEGIRYLTSLQYRYLLLIEEIRCVNSSESLEVSIRAVVIWGGCSIIKTNFVANISIYRNLSKFAINKGVFFWDTNNCWLGLYAESIPALIMFRH